MAKKTFELNSRFDPAGDQPGAIQALVDQLTWDDLLAKIQWLVDFGTRYSFDPMCAVAAESLHWVFVPDFVDDYNKTNLEQMTN